MTIDPRYTYKLAQLRPTVNFANRMSTHSNESWGPRTIPDCEFVYIFSGSGYSISGGQRYELSSGDCIFYGENDPHLLASYEEDPFTYASIHFHWDRPSPEPIHPALFIQSCTQDALSEPTSVYEIVVAENESVLFPTLTQLYAIETLFLQIVDEYRQQKTGYAFAMRGLLIQLITVMIRHQLHGQRSSEAMAKINPALKAVHEQPYYNWTTAELARFCGYHPTYFASLFKETMGYSPKHYVIQERIRKAKYYLLEYDTIEAVAEKLGYTSVHYFSRNFKEVTGLTPSEFRLRSGG